MNDQPTIFELMTSVIADVEPVGKNTSHQQGYKYRGVDEITIAADVALKNHGVIGPIPELQAVAYESTEIGAKRTPTRIAQVQVGYRVYGPRGDSIFASVAAEAMDSGDKATPKAMSVAYRTALLQLLRIPTGEPDPAAQDYRRSEPWTAPELAKKAIGHKRNRERLLNTYNLAKQNDLLDDLVVNEDGAEEPLGAMVTRLGEAAAKLPKQTARRRALIATATPEPELAGDRDE